MRAKQSMWSSQHRYADSHRETRPLSDVDQHHYSRSTQTAVYVTQYTCYTAISLSAIYTFLCSISEILSSPVTATVCCNIQWNSHIKLNTANIITAAYSIQIHYTLNSYTLLVCCLIISSLNNNGWQTISNNNSNNFSHYFIPPENCSVPLNSVQKTYQFLFQLKIIEIHIHTYIHIQLHQWGYLLSGICLSFSLATCIYWSNIHENLQEICLPSPPIDSIWVMMFIWR